MKRRTLVHYGVLSSLAFCSTAVLGDRVRSQLPPAQNSPTRKQSYDWLFLYWMPYDNDLSRFGDEILAMMVQGLQSDNILAVVEADLHATARLSRHIITNGKIKTQALETTNSANEANFADYLHWANATFEARKWAIVFLGHGGELDRISPDEHAIQAQNKTQWMNIKTLSDIVTRFNPKIGHRVELLFFQNCNKGTIEVHYTLRHAARYTLSSQKILGAPNYYYQPLFQFLSRHPHLDGAQLAGKIREFERSDMYSSYTVTQNRYFADIQPQISAIVDSILKSDLKKIDLSKLKQYDYWGEQYVDLVEFLTTIAEQANLQQKTDERLARLLNRVLVHLPNPNIDEKDLSGLGLFLPSSQDELEKYRYLPVYSDLKLGRLFEAILF